VRQPLLPVLAIALLLVPSNLPAWGDYGHRLIGLAAAQALPPDMPAFFREAAPRLSYLNPEPDRWQERRERTIDPALHGASSPEHFIDMDLVTPAVLAAALAAPHRFAFGDSLRGAGVPVTTMGVLPYRMLELAQQLRVNFRLWRSAPDSAVRHWIEQRIIEDAGILGHYVADGSNPLHTTKHYNGWVGANPKGYTTDNRFHSRFESAYVQAHVRHEDVSAAMRSPATSFPDLRAAVIEYLQASFSHLEALYAIEQRASFQAARSTPEQKAFAVARVAAGATMLRDIWYTAWVTSAPDATPAR
jgi:hypothetical protein